MATDNDLSKWQHALAPAFLWDAARRRIVWANAAAVNWFGAASLGDLVERTFGQREPAVTVLAEAARQLRTPDDCRDVELHFLSSGQPQQLAVRVCAHALPGGRPGLLVVARDTAAALAARPDMLKEVLHELPAAVAAVDANGALLFANPEALQLVGEEGLAGLHAFFPSLADARTFLLRALQAGAATLVRQVNTPFGPRQLRLSARPAHDEDFLVLILDDLTDRLAAERQGTLGLPLPSAEASATQADVQPLQLQEKLQKRAMSAPADTMDEEPKQDQQRQQPASALSAEELEILRRIAEALGSESRDTEHRQVNELPKPHSEPQTEAAQASAADVPQQKPQSGQRDTVSQETERERRSASRRRITIRRRSAPAASEKVRGESPSQSSRRQPRVSISTAADDLQDVREQRKAPVAPSSASPEKSSSSPQGSELATTTAAGSDSPVQLTEREDEEPQRLPRPEVPGLVRQVMDQQPDPVVLHRADAFYYANRAARELFGHELEDEAWDALATRLMQATDGSEIELADAQGRQHRFLLQRDAFPWQSGVVVQSTLKPLRQSAGPQKDEKRQKVPPSASPSSAQEPLQSRVASDDAARALETLSASLGQLAENHDAMQREQRTQEQPRRQQADIIRLRVSRPLPETGAQAIANADNESENESEEACDEVEIDAELRALLDTAADGIMTLNAAGRILSFSSGAARLFGLSAHEVIGRQFTELFAERDRAAIKEYLASLKAAARPGEGREVTGLTKEGEEIPLFLTIGRLRHGRLLEHEDHASYCVIVRDLSAWKRKESELVRAKEAAERASAQKSEFLAMISHELRTPLNAILGFADVLRQQMFGKLGNEKYLDYARDIYESGEHLLSLINDLLDLSRIEAGRFELDFVEVDLAAIVEETVHTMREQIAASGVQVRTAIPRRLPKVVADVRSMKQIMFNLLSNAIKFCNKGDLVTITLAKKDDGSVELLVRDTGPGMTREELANALEPFRRNEKGGTDQPPGTGLGLPLTKALAEANKAQFAIDSEPGRGTEVRITFPPHRVLI